jgi:peptidyl-prolyl cis-trans isomerase C
LPSHIASSIERATAARAVLESIAADSAGAGPPTEPEIAELQRERWAELDRPEGVRTVHAVAINKDPKRDAAARALAAKLVDAVKGATSADEFISLAKAVPADGIEVKVEPLPPITLDGRAFERTEKGFVGAQNGFDRDFARAAYALQQPGDLSPIVKTRFGYHVIRLVERFPASAMPRADLLSAFEPELQTRRAVRLRRELLEKLRSSRAVQVDRAVDELTARIQPTP